MTREEQMLNGFTEMMKGFWNNQDLEVPNLEMPCKREPCDDAISRKAVLDALKKCEPLIDYDEHDRRETYYEAEEVEFKIMSLPSIYPQNTDVLDKIRAEIEEHRNKTKYIDQYDLVGDCLDIIDKYKEGEIRNDLSTM